MTEEQVERVARALARKARVSEMEANGFNGIHLNEYVDACWADHKDRARAAIAALPPQGDGWQDIASAPKAWTRVLIWDDGVYLAYWSETCQHGQFQVGPGWQIFDCPDRRHSVAADNPTHWRSLPKPPAPPAAELERTKG